MAATISTEQAREVFAAAAGAHWTKTNLGHIAQVRAAHYTYRVVVDASLKYLARIDYREGHGGPEEISGAERNATPAQHRDIVAALLADTHRTQERAAR